MFLAKTTGVAGPVVLLAIAACDGTVGDLDDDLLTARAPATVQCDPGNGGITLPAGFCAVVVADLTMDGEPANARHMVVLPNGDILVAINAPRNNQPSFGIVALRDTNQDGRADQQTQFSPGLGGSGIAWMDGLLYLGANDRVIRYMMPPGAMQPTSNGEVLVSGLPNTEDHISKTLVLRDRNSLFVNVGSASNSCQVDNREEGSPGKFPCDELPIRAGVWLFDTRVMNQTQAMGQRWATGLRNMVALALQPGGELFGVQHGRDQLFEHWPEFYTVEEDAVLPAEELIRIGEGSDNGWPYCYFDAVSENKKVLAPEYGGNGQLVSGGAIDCSSYNQPLVTFGAHWAPNGMHFYTGHQFPGRYQGGAFVAFHGGFDRAPLPNEGYQVVFVPFAGPNPTGEWETFANGFAASSGPLPANAVHRPVGVAEGPDGSLYISDDKGGRIWRVIYRGQ